MSGFFKERGKMLNLRRMTVLSLYMWRLHTDLLLDYHKTPLISPGLLQLRKGFYLFIYLFIYLFLFMGKQITISKQDYD